MEPVLADTEVLLTALNVKAMSFRETDDDDDLEEEREDDIQVEDEMRNKKRNSILGDLIEVGHKLIQLWIHINTFSEMTFLRISILH